MEDIKKEKVEAEVKIEAETKDQVESEVHAEPEKKTKEQELAEEIEKLKEDNQGLKDARLRLLAEFDNYKKRTARETVNLISTANEEIVSNILPVLENFERAIHPDHNTPETEKLFKGVEMIYNQFFDILRQAGLKEDNPIGDEFNPEKHEAVMQEASADIPEHHIVRVLQKGYVLNTKVLQYAKVVVSKGNN
ncbi:MAG: nucleotide exchange factor GrpE [Candidatus Raymondbacteria bacterium RifOxyA12_full_50_37]|uniref:Protein GrpE n=1 Tax=Candidatus Raymondbacteria bacterium RIFOXYD12_FULL_49_13 TaxID=1817890 RepID=A0A1F7FIK6_UNCRA|nr:MAG: nucleotide exchange factor GrpE [Candidatus Raymondbacteria bacterium RifOxyA12_full_50_37]OGJ87473.1 MAG: nucleotide exchange factor GrpE [Candidatus Raymondbacteria bacterium RIFOXYA2_FULL_49_16]OGJ94899.1 MAG: nucleotide exchange factor GrpE [Candidatus Raymondbacteria bacterium RifOxyC12_full_50_8]OGJ96413.1 MAG: nucleotide exchange factor GrpE [Candidatus Raymondbacteria bacterium RIFOXYC2_FULL_50_21]OGJ99572.1 MAG: nucleotide exchange factor GrpE [Candidatus Raymondbacteria bacter